MNGVTVSSFVWLFNFYKVESHRSLVLAPPSTTDSLVPLVNFEEPRPVSMDGAEPCAALKDQVPPEPQCSSDGRGLSLPISGKRGLLSVEQIVCLMLHFTGAVHTPSRDSGIGYFSEDETVTGGSKLQV